VLLVVFLDTKLAEERKNTSALCFQIVLGIQVQLQLVSKVQQPARQAEHLASK
jgi:hypothetical protein